MRLKFLRRGRLAMPPQIAGGGEQTDVECGYASSDQVGLLGWSHPDGHVHQAGGEVGLRRAQVELKADVRIQPCKVSKHRTQVCDAEVHRHRGANHAAGAGLQLCQLSVRQFGVLHDAPAVVEVLPPALGQIHPARGAVQQAQAHVALELGDAPRHRRAGQPQRQRGLAKAAGLRHRHENLHVPEGVHRLIVPSGDQSIAQRHLYPILGNTKNGLSRRAQPVTAQALQRIAMTWPHR